MAPLVYAGIGARKTPEPDIAPRYPVLALGETVFYALDTDLSLTSDVLSVHKEKDDAPGPPSTRPARNAWATTSSCCATPSPAGPSSRPPTRTSTATRAREAVGRSRHRRLEGRCGVQGKDRACRFACQERQRAASFRRNDERPNLLPKGLIAFPGSGITDNLVDKAVALGIPVQRCAA